MNICFFSGKIISNPEFKFIINKEKSFKKCQHYGICTFKIELLNKTIIEAYAYDELADYCYKKIKENNYIYISGILEKSNNLLKIQIDNLKII